MWKSVKVFFLTLSSVCIRYQLLHIIAYINIGTLLIQVPPFHYHHHRHWFPSSSTPIVNWNVPLLWATPQHTYALRQSINWMLINFFDFFFFKFCRLKTKDKLLSTLHCFFIDVDVVDFTDDFVDELFRGLKFLSRSVLYTSKFCGFKLCDSVIHQNHFIAISFALLFFPLAHTHCRWIIR